MFVIIFRQGPVELTQVDKQKRSEETSEWAKVQNSAGHQLEPRILESEAIQHGAETQGGNAWPITALLFLKAHDLDEAARVAESHPAIRYGASVEVRPWAPPRAF
jgi:hypothetical protein